MSTNAEILYVDDETINLKLFQLNFMKNFLVHTGTSGAEGLEILEKQPGISVVISDMKMPVMNGVEFIRITKQRFPHIKFFILTGFEITPEIADALNENVIHKYFRKPFKAKEIEEAIKNALNL